MLDSTGTGTGNTGTGRILIVTDTVPKRLHGDASKRGFAYLYASPGSRLLPLE